MSQITSHHNPHEMSLFGFWTYIMTDCVLFATLFATYLVLEGNTYGGPSGKDLFDLKFALAETLVLLMSSFTCGLAMLSVKSQTQKKIGHLIFWFIVTFCLGATFVGMEVTEFLHFIREGNGPSRSGFLSGFFTLVGTHGLHVSFSLLWMIILLCLLIRDGKMTPLSWKRFDCLRLFWHFLDVVWIFLFTVVYLKGGI